MREMRKGATGGEIQSPASMQNNAAAAKKAKPKKPARQGTSDGYMPQRGLRYMSRDPKNPGYVIPKKNIPLPAYKPLPPKKPPNTAQGQMPN